MTINEEILTRLNVKEIAYLAVAVGFYTDKIKNKKDDVRIDLNKLISRLGDELYSHPVNDFTKTSNCLKL